MTSTSKRKDRRRRKAKSISAADRRINKYFFKDSIPLGAKTPRISQFVELIEDVERLDLGQAEQPQIQPEKEQ